MKDQLKTNELTDQELERAIQWLTDCGFEPTVSGDFIKDDCRVVFTSDGIVYKKGIQTTDGLSVGGLIERLKEDSNLVSK